MSATFLHQRKDFKSLISTLATERGILDALIEKDYWIMHALYGMKNLGLDFELKGGTSLFKGFIISLTAFQRTLICIFLPRGHLLNRLELR